MRYINLRYLFTKGMVCLQCESCVIYIWALQEVSFLLWGAIQMSVFTFTFWCAICRRFSRSTPRSRDVSATMRSTDARSPSTSRSPQGQGHVSSRHQGLLNGGTNDATVALTFPSDLWNLPRPWRGLTGLSVLRSPGTDPPLLTRYDANPFDSLTAGSLLLRPQFETRPSSTLTTFPRLPALIPVTQRATSPRSAELPASTTHDQRFRPPSTLVTSSSSLLPASKLHEPADARVLAYLDFRSRDIAATNGLVAPSQSYRISPVWMRGMCNLCYKY